MINAFDNGDLGIMNLLLKNSFAKLHCAVTGCATVSCKSSQNEECVLIIH